MSPKKKASKAPAEPLPPFEFEPPAAHQVQAVLSGAPQYVRCRICNVSMNHLNFEWPAVPTTMDINSIKQALVKRHGGAVHTVRLWLDQVSPSSYVSEDDQWLTLRALGVKGAHITEVGGQDLPLVTIHYDYDAPLADDIIASADLPVCTTGRLTLNAAYQRQGL